MTSNEILNTIKWELEILLRDQKELRLCGREMLWREEERLKELRIRLDAALGIKPEKKEKEDDDDVEFMMKD